MNRFQNLHQAIELSLLALKTQGKRVETTKWQGMNVTETPKSTMWELLHYRLESPMPNDVSVMKELIKPNLPWADEHFAERVGEKPTNPGYSYKNWPFYPNGNDAGIRKEKFTHTYQERFWPKKAWDEDTRPPNGRHVGIRFEYGDLKDVVQLMIKEPTTRQAYLPIWFPEDTGAVHGGRVPCSLGYWFVMRDGKLNIEYTIRACDALRHFRDDVYFAVRLAKYMIDVCSQLQPTWGRISMGDLIMNIGSLHVFNGEQKLL